MSRKVLILLVSWALAGGVLLAAGGCARFRGKAPAAAEQSPPAVPEEPGGAEAAGNGAVNGKRRLVLDQEEVARLQRAALEEQRGAADDCLLRRGCRFARWLDRVHETWFRRMDNAVRVVDTKWLSDNEEYEPELSTFRLRTLMRLGGRSSEKETEIKVRFRGDLALPGLENKIHLILENADEDSLPGEDPMDQKNDTRLGLSTAWKTLRNNELELGGGLKWRESLPVAYMDLEWRWEREMGGGRLRLNPRGYYFTDNGFGQVTTLTWTKQVGRRSYFQIVQAERSSESSTGVQFEQSFRFARLRSGRGRGWVFQASVFPHLVSSDWVWDDSLLNVTWRDALYRRWIYYTITPQVQFPKEDAYEPRPSLRIGLDVLFGGRVSDLI